ncbi:MAG: superfamily I DNA/RNA helicase, partial [Gammaproteobacteria bacterium]
GKTNLLLLRAQFIAGKGEKNVLIVSFTKALADFMRNGVAGNGIIDGQQVRTFHSWATEHIGHYLGKSLVANGSNFDDATRLRAIELVRDANKKLPAQKLYDGIFVDEAQDFSCDELECLLSLSDKICVCGDVKQGIYQRDGLDIGHKLGLATITLQRHYRIGQRIAQVADKLLPPAEGEKSLEATANYNPKVQGASTAHMHDCSSRDQQFGLMLEKIALQMDAFKGDSIGILCGKRDTANGVAERLFAIELTEHVCLHGPEGGTFGDCSLIHIMTIHSSNGTEFRAVHIFGAEELKGRLSRRQLLFTAVTRAKTALNAYRTGATNAALESAFAEPKHMELAELFPEQK